MEVKDKVPAYVDARGLFVLVVTAAIIAYGIYTEDSPAGRAIMFIAYVFAFAFEQTITRRN